MVDVKTATSTATVTPKVSNTIGGSAQITALNIVIQTDNRGKVSGDLVERRRRPRLDRDGERDSDATATTTISIAASAMLIADERPHGRRLGDGQRELRGGHAQCRPRRRRPRSRDLDPELHDDDDVAGTLTAGGKLTVKSRTNITGNANGSAQGGGLGVDADSAGTVNIGTGEADSTNAVTRTTIKDRARLSGDKVEIDAIVDSLYARSVRTPWPTPSGQTRTRPRPSTPTASPRSCSRRRARTPATRSSATRPSGSRRCTTTSTSRRARTRPATASRATRRRRSDIYYDTAAKVTGRDESFIETADLTVDANQNIDRYDKHANAHGGAFVGHHEPTRRRLERLPPDLLGNDGHHARRAEPGPDRRRERQDHEARQLSVTDENGNPYGLVDTIPAGHQIWVGDIQYDTSGFARFRADHVSGAPDSEIWGNAGLFDFQETWDYVQILNSSDRTLVTHLIDVVNGNNSAIIRIDVDHVPGPVNSPADDTSISETGASGSTFEFDIKHSFVPTLVEIRNLQPGGIAASNIVLEGALATPHNGEDTDVTIENPIGTTIVDNQRGNIIVTSSAPKPFLLLRTNVLRSTPTRTPCRRRPTARSAPTSPRAA